jgi:hypothetical protein
VSTLRKNVTANHGAPHERGDLARLTNVRRVSRERCCLRRESRVPPLSVGGFRDCLASGFGAGDASATCDLVESAQTVGIERQGKALSRPHSAAGHG